ncbi:MAG: site-2 protease family protein [Candidatus Pacebacteria bacterium]|nr:site-2 protease family protein [Candidatus Paceibacterota bacterium]
MFLTILIASLSLIGLVTLHEFGHFIVAKKFGVKVEEFGIGFPPRIFGKKIGDTIYSLNLLPLGAFVKMPGEIGQVNDPRSFSGQAVWKRALIAFAGVLSFWIVAAILFAIVFNLGTAVAVDDEASGLVNPRVQIASISAGSPAKLAGLQPGDTIKGMAISEEQLAVGKIREVQEFSNTHLGEEIVLTVERGNEVFDVKVVPRVSPPAGEGPLGVALVRTAMQSFSWYQAPWQGLVATVNMTGAIIKGYGQVISNIVQGQSSGVELMGPVGVVHLFTQASQMGTNYFLQFVGIVAIYIAIFNILPIPAVDGGKILFLGIEAIRRRPISEKVEQNITAVFFSLLLLLMVLVTIKDVARLF